MSANKHTPGPWKTVQEAEDGDDDYSVYSLRVAMKTTRGLNMTERFDRYAANERVASAAPDMLEAAEALIHRVAIPHDSPERIALVAAAAIKKARGEK